MSDVGLDASRHQCAEKSMSKKIVSVMQCFIINMFSQFYNYTDHSHWDNFQHNNLEVQLYFATQKFYRSQKNSSLIKQMF